MKRPSPSLERWTRRAITTRQLRRARRRSRHYVRGDEGSCRVMPPTLHAAVPSVRAVAQKPLSAAAAACRAAAGCGAHLPRRPFCGRKERDTLGTLAFVPQMGQQDRAFSPLRARRRERRKRPRSLVVKRDTRAVQVLGRRPSCSQRKGRPANGAMAELCLLRRHAVRWCIVGPFRYCDTKGAGVPSWQHSPRFGLKRHS